LAFLQFSQSALTRRKGATILLGRHLPIFVAQQSRLEVVLQKLQCLTFDQRMEARFFMHASQVLLVDRSNEARDVLRTALEHHGLRVLEATIPADGFALARLHQPDVIVLDLDALQANKPTAADFANLAEIEGSTLIMLGTNSATYAQLSGEFFAKPYHYKPLILRINELLKHRFGRAAA
jgi:CheY-like chemotaxis protein